MGLWLTELHLLFVTNPESGTFCNMQLPEYGPKLRSQNVCYMYYLSFTRQFSVGDKQINKCGALVE